MSHSSRWSPKSAPHAQRDVKHAPPVYNPCPPREVMQGKVCNTVAPQIYRPCPPREAVQAKLCSTTAPPTYKPSNTPIQLQARLPMPRPANSQVGLIQPKFTVTIDGNKKIHVLSETEVALPEFSSLPRVDVRTLPEFKGLGIFSPIAQSEYKKAKALKGISSFADKIQEQLINNNEIVVHCVKGKHRSVTTVITFLVKYKGMKWDEAKRVVTEAAATEGWELQQELVQGSVNSLSEFDNGKIWDKMLNTPSRSRSKPSSSNNSVHPHNDTDKNQETTPSPTSLPRSRSVRPRSMFKERELKADAKRWYGIDPAVELPPRRAKLTAEDLLRKK
jgi:Dual specificity phosphatase, catalytic domain